MQIAFFVTRLISDFFCDLFILCLIALIVLFVHDQQRAQTALVVVPPVSMVLWPRTVIILFKVLLFFPLALLAFSLVGLCCFWCDLPSEEV